MLKDLSLNRFYWTIAQWLSHFKVCLRWSMRGLFPALFSKKTNHSVKCIQIVHKSHNAKHIRKPRIPPIFPQRQSIEASAREGGSLHIAVKERRAEWTASPPGAADVSRRANGPAALQSSSHTVSRLHVCSLTSSSPGLPSTSYDGGIFFNTRQTC